MKPRIETTDGGRTFVITDSEGSTVLLTRLELDDIVDDANVQLIVTQEIDEKSA